MSPELLRYLEELDEQLSPDDRQRLVEANRRLRAASERITRALEGMPHASADAHGTALRSAVPRR